jgi:hypothetical protein
MSLWWAVVFATFNAVKVNTYGNIGEIQCFGGCCQITWRPSLLPHTAKTQYRKFKTNIPKKGIAQRQFQFPHSWVCEQFIYSHHRSAYSAAGKYVDRSWEYINSSQTHECGNWDWGRAIPRKGIHEWDFCCIALIHWWNYWSSVPAPKKFYNLVKAYSKTA